MLFVVIAYLWISLFLYLLLGGADFGAGIMEIFTAKKYEDRLRATTYKSLGPIWEANHMWLIIAIVILFVGFPTIYSTISTYLHIPLALMLLGVIARGTAFTFRHYDAIEDGWQPVYNKIFQLSSLMTPFFLGIIAASTVAASIDPNTNEFLEAYVFSWLTPFGITVGIFTISISAYLSSVFIIGEAKEEDLLRYSIKNVRKYFFFVILAGIIVFATSYYEEVPLTTWIFGQTIGQVAIFLASISVFVLFYALKRRMTKLMRVCTGIQVFMILLAATYNHYPNLVLLKNSDPLSLIDLQGSEKTIETLAWALLLGSIFILPFFVYLLYAFHKKANMGSSKSEMLD